MGITNDVQTEAIASLQVELANEKLLTLGLINMLVKPSTELDAEGVPYDWCAITEPFDGGGQFHRTHEAAIEAVYKAAAKAREPK